ncbi:MAG TPA: S41 family peptidase [Chryseosolibacter sp.]|nr:S41 family peptidase [Chryseosolibacter sp.]
MNLKNSHRFFLTLITLAIFAAACDNDKVEPANTETPPINKDEYVNNWILKNMQYYYYWNTRIQVNADKAQTPDQYFADLLVDQDRFSWIQDNYQELLNSLNGVSKEPGFEFVLYRDSEQNSNVICQIVYIKPNSPAARILLNRGTVITHINGRQLTMSNYKTLLASLSRNHSLTYHKYKFWNESFAEPVSRNIVPVEYTENPNYLHKIIDKGGRKIGYFIYNFFANGPTSDSEQYNDEMDQIFAQFKAEGISDMVVDLRFNSGGNEKAANNLASLLRNGTSTESIFAKRKFNSTLTDEIIKDPELGPDYLDSKFITKTANIGNHLAVPRIYFLTSQKTASASELVINSLKPFMDVVLIGNTTYGKNVGSFSLYDDEDSANTWGMQPIVLKMSNSRGESDYEEGFTPNVVDLDNSLLLRPLGDPEERLLSLAIAEITGNPAGGRIAAKKQKGFQAVGHSLDLKRRSFRLVMDKNDPLTKGLREKINVSTKH